MRKWEDDMANGHKGEGDCPVQLVEQLQICLTIALCSYPIVKMEIRDSSQILTTAPIFLHSKAIKGWIGLVDWIGSFLEN